MCVRSSARSPFAPLFSLALSPIAAAQWHFSVDTPSPENAAMLTDPAQLFRMELPAPPPFATEVSFAALGLTSGDEVDAFSRGSDYVPAMFTAPVGESISYFFSISRGSVGALAAVTSETGPLGNGAAGDVFLRYTTTPPPTALPVIFPTFKFREATRIGLTPRGAGTESNVDALQYGSIFYHVGYYFSVDEQTAARRGLDKGAIYVTPGGAPGPQVFATKAALGLRAGDDIDALCVADRIPYFVFGPEDRVMLSLRAGSPTLAANAWSGASLLSFVGRGPLALFATATMMGLLAADDLDALWIGDPGGRGWSLTDPVNDGAIWPGAATFTSRIGLGLGNGEVLQGVPEAVVRGVGDVGGVAFVTGLRATVQDQDAATPESCSLVLRAESPHGSGLPQVGATGTIAASAPIALPPGPSGPAAWSVTVTLGTPAVIPGERSHLSGVALPAAPQWPNDGLSVHMASYATGTEGDNPRAGAPDHSICVAQPGDRIVRAMSPRTLDVSVLTPMPRLNVGADIAAALRRGPNPCYGWAGSYPDVAGRADGLAFRVHDAANPGGAAAVFLSIPSTGVFDGIAGQLYLDLRFLTLVGSAWLDANGRAEARPSALAQGRFPVLPPGSRLLFQAASLGTRIRLTNAQVTVF